MSQIKWYGDGILAELRGDVPDALLEAAQGFLEDAKSRAPRDSGDLQDSGYVGTKDKSTYQSKKNHAKEVKAKEGEAVAGFAAFYSKWVEFGTKHAAAKPFMRPALDSAKEKMAGVITARLRKVFKK